MAVKTAICFVSVCFDVFVLGLEWYWYWVIGTGQYSQIFDSFVIGGYFLLFWHPIHYQADSSQHHPHASERLFSSTFDLYSDRRNRLDTMLICCCLLNTIVVIIIQFWDFSWSLVIAVLYTSNWYWYWVLVLLGANIIGYWILGAFLGIVLTLVCLLQSYVDLLLYDNSDCHIIVSSYNFQL